jgi:hypothetical protein
MQPYRRVPASRFVNPRCPDQTTGTPDHCAVVKSSEPEVFGPIAWAHLHTVAENYEPDNDKAVERCAAWLDNTPPMLPCRNCERHMQKWVDCHDSRQACASKESLRSYFVDLHNAVNKRTHGDNPWTPEQAQARYATAELCMD